MNFIPLIASLMMLLLLTACGKGGKSSADKKIKLSPEMMAQIMANQEIKCAEAAFCPEGIVRIFTVNYDDAAKSSNCTGFLIGPDLVMTNSHCVYAGKINLEKTCERIHFAFATRYGHTYQARCEEIIWRDPRQNGSSTYNEGDKDFALVKIDRYVPVKPLRLDKKELPVGSKVHPVVIDHIDLYTARLVKLDCFVDESVESSGLVRLSKCPVIGGNSGSAIVDDNGNVVAILFASNDPNVKKATDPLPYRKQATSFNLGFAFSMTFVESILGQFIY
jgi:V8-like Glu-specific endopeptidase